MTPKALQALSGPIIKPASGGKPKQIVLFLHGLGADGNDLIDLAQMIAPLFPDAMFISPHAPFPCDMAPYGYQWFSLQRRDEEIMMQGVQEAEPILNAAIDALLEEHGLPASKLAVVGFSQGTMMALHTLPRREEAVAGIVGFSGALLKPQALKEAARSKPPVLLVHGEDDMVVPFGAMEIAEQGLKDAGIAVQTMARPMLGHGIDNDGLSAMERFLQQVLV